jgi:chemotaxis signal transduction protein
MVKLEDKIVMIVNLEKIFTDNELESLKLID